MQNKGKSREQKLPSILGARYKNYRIRARNKGLEFSLSKKQFVALLKADCALCGAKPKPKSRKKNGRIVGRAIAINGVDRIDSSKGYRLDNCQTLCGTCNIMKSTHSQKKFLNHLKRITEMQHKKNKDLPIVEIVWVDAYSTDEWATLDDHANDEPYLVRSIGFLLNETKDHITIIKSYTLAEQLGSMSLKIPKGMVREMYFLEFGK